MISNIILHSFGHGLYLIEKFFYPTSEVGIKSSDINEFISAVTDLISIDQMIMNVEKDKIELVVISNCIVIPTKYELSSFNEKLPILMKYQNIERIGDLIKKITAT